MRRTCAGLAALTALMVPDVASAHGLGSVKDLPLPMWLFYYGGAIVLVLSFVALGALWREPRLESETAWRPLPEPLQRILLSPALRILLGTVSFGLYLMVMAACFVGTTDTRYNLGPTFVWVIFWLGVVPLVVALGNVWRVLSPWLAAADAVSWVARRFGHTPRTERYPDRFGRWPAVLLLLLFTTFELAYTSPSDPATLGFAALIYSVITWFGMFVYGIDAWARRGDAFSVYFELLSRLAPFAAQSDQAGRRQIVVRRPLAGLTVRDAVPGTLAFVAVMLGSVTFDGLSRTVRWLTWRYDVRVSGPYGDQLAILLNIGGLLATIVAVALAFLLAVRIAQLVGRRDTSLAGSFLFSLVPIALAYAVAHYFSLLINQGQYAVRLISDPLGRGWDLFGTTDFHLELTVLPIKTIWYIQVAALVVGHVLGLVLAHDRAVALFGSARVALRTQYAMLALMVLYTTLGLWLLSQG